MTGPELPCRTPCWDLCGGVHECPVPCDDAGAHQVLARIDASQWLARPETYRAEVRAWLEANGIVPNDVLIEDVVVVVVDGPAIVRREVVRDCNGNVLRDPYATDDTSRICTRVVHSLLRVPLPEHLVDPPLPACSDLDACKFGDDIIRCDGPQGCHGEVGR